MISEDDMRKEAEEIARDMHKTPPKSDTRYIWLILGLGIVALIILMSIPRYAVRLDSQPDTIPKPNEVVSLTQIPNMTQNVGNLAFAERINVRPEIKRTADLIVGRACREAAGPSQVCYAKALYYFTKDNMLYIGDPPDEYLKTPEESLLSLGGDCDDHTILLASLLSSVGISSRLVFIPGHVFLEARLPDALKRYKSDDDWVPMDPTCDNCEFGDLPLSDNAFPKRYLYI